MLEPDKLLAFVATASSLMLTPGPAKLLLLTVSASQGVRSGSRLAFGIFLSDAIHVGLVAFGLGALIIASGFLRLAIATVGAGVLLYFALTYATKAVRGAAAASSAEVAEEANRPLVMGLSLNLLNPLAIAFYAALLPQFADTASGLAVPLQIAAYGAALSAIFLVAHIVLVLIASRAKRRQVSDIWFRMSYAAAGAVMLWLCDRMILGVI